MLHIGSRGDPDTVEGSDTRAFGRTGRFLLVDGDAHGTELVAEHPALVATIAAFLRQRRSSCGSTASATSSSCRASSASGHK